MDGSDVPLPPGRARARAYLKAWLADPAAIYGAAEDRAGWATSAGVPNAQFVFFGVVRMLARTALQLASEAGAPGTRLRELPGASRPVPRTDSPFSSSGAPSSKKAPHGGPTDAPGALSQRTALEAARASGRFGGFFQSPTRFFAGWRGSPSAPENLLAGPPASLAPLETLREAQVLALFALVTGQVDDALEILRRADAGEPISQRAWIRVEASLTRRAVSLSGDPAFGLLLHTGALHLDAQHLGREAIALFSKGTVDEKGARRRVALVARQKALLVELQTALVSAERSPTFAARRAILRQIGQLDLPAPDALELRTAVKAGFRRRRGLHELVKKSRGRESGRFLLEQALLASLVDGRRTSHELAFLRELAVSLGFSEAELAESERRMREFYRRHHDVVDLFTESEASSLVSEELLDDVSRSVEKNFHALVKELKETGELSVLLARVARGQTLTVDERRRMRAQLIDVAKVVPALAIFAAPGGVLLLIALAKVLKVNLLPSAFQEEGGEDVGAPSHGGTAHVGAPAGAKKEETLSPPVTAEAATREPASAARKTG